MERVIQQGKNGRRIEIQGERKGQDRKLTQKGIKDKKTNEERTNQGEEKGRKSERK